MHILDIFIEIQVPVSLLCAHPLMTSINFILEESTLNKTSVTYLISMFRLMFIFEFWLGEKQLFHISPFHSWCYVQMRLGCLEVSNRVSNWNKAKTSFSCGRYFKYANWKYRYSYTVYFPELIMNLSSIWVLCI